MKSTMKKALELLKENMPNYNENRRVLILSEDTKKGKEVIARASRYDGYFLNQIYERASNEKEQIYKRVFEQYVNDKDSEAFSICSHNSQVFSVSWVNRYGVKLLTRDYDYLVVTNDALENIFTDFN